MLLDKIADHFQCQWTPPSLCEDPVKWMARSFNKVADGLADLTMDNRKSWTQRFCTSLAVGDANIIVQTDGGRREADCAATGFIIGLWDTKSGTKLYEPLMAHDTFMDNDCTVLVTEAIALDEATAAVQQILHSQQI